MLIGLLVCFLMFLWRCVRSIVFALLNHFWNKPRVSKYLLSVIFVRESPLFSDLNHDEYKHKYLELVSFLSFIFLQSCQCILEMSTCDNKLASFVLEKSSNFNAKLNDFAVPVWCFGKLEPVIVPKRTHVVTIFVLLDVFSYLAWQIFVETWTIKWFRHPYLSFECQFTDPMLYEVGKC